MSTPTPAQAALADAARHLAEAPEPGWVAIRDSVIATVRSTARRTTPIAASTRDLTPTGGPAHEGETTHVSDHVIATHLNRAITQAHRCAPAEIVLSLAGDHLRAASVHIVGAYGADLHALGEAVRATATTVLTDLLGPQHPPLGIDQVEVRVEDITADDPRRS